MKDSMMWAYYIMLSNHMWEDELVGPTLWYRKPYYQDNNNVDFEVWDRVIAFLAERKYNTMLIDVGDAVKFESHPEISAPDAVSIDFLRKKLDEMRAVGITPIPKLNFSTCHHTWLKEYRFMVGTQKYLDVCSDLIRETFEIFDGPELFHLGMDEEDDISCHARRTMVSFRREERFWHDFYHFFDVCEKLGTRPWVWSDYYWNNRELFIKHMPKSVLQSNWFYAAFQDYPEGHPHKISIDAFEELDQLGYDQVPTCSTWKNNYNSGQMVAHCKEKLSSELFKGMLTASWLKTDRENVYSLFNDADQLYLGRKEFYPETL